ncbi:hypothetical protein, partial [Pseudomonas mosselii]|uniref:hypothetical protein n=1 Tax=Pseudomonas mosselii TaxID=78327 RepID=UPI001C70DBF3
HHFHTDHPVFSCSKIEQKQLNTWVSFQSAEQPLLGQFSVSGNMINSSSARRLTLAAFPAHFPELLAFTAPRMEGRTLFHPLLPITAHQSWAAS